MMSIEEIYDRVLALSANVQDNFLELGRSLRQLQHRDPDLFQQAIKKKDLGRRKAYYLVEVSRTFDKAPVPRSRLRKIGWTKLQLIGKHVTAANLEELLTLAESVNSKELERQMKGETPIDSARYLIFYLKPEDYAEIEQALKLCGAAPSGRGLRKKEKALLRMTRAVRKKHSKAE